MPSSIKRAEEYGDDLVTIFVEVQGHTMDDVLTLGYDKGWMGTDAMWTTERPFNTGSRGIPNYALISADGRILAKGNPLADHSKIKDLIEEEISKASKGPENMPKSVRKAYGDFNKGKLAKAIEAAQKLVEKEDEDSRAAEAAIRDFEARIQGRLDRAKWMVENGFLVKAEDYLKDLSKGLKGSEQEAAANELLESIASDENKVEYDADKDFAKLHVKLNDDGLADTKKDLEKFLDKHAGTKAAERAQRLMELI